MSSNLLKRGYTFVRDEEKRVIDTNSLIAQKLENIVHISMDLPQEADASGFAGGLEADTLDGLLADGNTEEGRAGVIKAAAPEPVYEGPSPEELLEEARAEIAEMQAEARRTLEAEKKKALEEAKKQGYQEGHVQALNEYRGKEQELEREKARLEEWYQQQVDALEPEFIDTLTGIYEHIFHVDLKGYREIIVHLINATLRKIEGSRDFIVHVSKADYPYVSMQKKQILSGASAGSSTVEIIEDMTLANGECLIETNSGIFDCSMGTELEELSKKLRLLSYERSEQQDMP